MCIMTDVVTYELRGRTALITLNRPEARNAVNGDVANGIEAAIDRFEDETEAWTGVLAANGSVFCAGADLKLFSERRDGEMFTEKGHFAGIVKRARTKPLIAAVDGPALAGGFEIALACDLLVASKAARFGLPEVTRSLVAAAGGLARIPRLLPQQTSLHILLTGDPMSAERAYELGLVSQLVEPGEALDAALVMAEKINGNAPIAVRETLRLAQESPNVTFDEAFRASRKALGDLSSTNDYAEGPRAFAEKRPPVWTGT
jgi:enoyl-CoA hydratase